MINVLDPAKLAQLAALSRQLAAAGAPPAMERPIVIDENGYAYGVVPGDAEAGSFVHAGVRVGWAPLPLQGGVMVSIWGGLEFEKEFEKEGVVAYFTRDGLRRLAADLQAIADASVDA
ncbi:hypothetical protein [Sphingomonas melonis]|uniref:Uncharacterized protein n=1 Tax=Sphingomonas melonis TaxID=152682 RepID=A0A7Y9K1W7_9SPHN|nr:hypothetical protein [Sphingomonas melonis]NYD91428.1 hypothetical protein [Sphingomonas melonis]